MPYLFPQCPCLQSLGLLVNRLKASPYTAVLAAYGAMLNRWSGQHAVIVGASYGNRQPETKNLVGYFLNMLALKVELTEGLTFAGLVEQVSSAVSLIAVAG